MTDTNYLDETPSKVNGSAETEGKERNRRILDQMKEFTRIHRPDDYECMFEGREERTEKPFHSDRPGFWLGGDWHSCDPNLKLPPRNTMTDDEIEGLTSAPETGASSRWKGQAK